MRDNPSVGSLATGTRSFRALDAAARVARSGRPRCVLAVPATGAVVHLYRNLSSDIQELLPQSAASVRAMHELRARLPGLSSLGVVVAAPTRGFPGRGSPGRRPGRRGSATYPPNLVRNVRTGSGNERQFIEQHAAMFVDAADLAEIRARIQAERDWHSRKALGISFDDEPPPGLDFKDLEAKYETKYHVRLMPSTSSRRRKERSGAPRASTPIPRRASPWCWSRGRSRRRARTGRASSSPGCNVT